MSSLENIDKIIERTGVSYKEAKIALEKCNDDVIDAIMSIEDRKFDTKKNKFLDNMKGLFKRFMKIKVKIEKDNKKILSLPLLAIAAILIFTPWYIDLLTIASLIVVSQLDHYNVSIQL